MTSPASSPCRRALRSHITPSRDAVWITDSALASAFNRYCRVSSTWTRHASNVPGPLESQRRLGRRRMADASSWYCPPAPPSWAFSVPLNLSKYTWKPPSSHQDSAHRSPRQADSPLAALVSVPRGWWLGSASPGEAAESPAAPSDTVVSDTVLPSSSLIRIFPAPTLDMDALRRAVVHATDETFAFHVRTFCRELRQSIALGDILPDNVLSLSVDIWGVLEARFQGSPLEHRLSLAVCKAVLDGLTESRVFSPDMLNLRFWNMLLSVMAKIPVSDTLCSILVQAMWVMPAVNRPLVSKHLLPILSSFLSAWGRLQHAHDNGCLARLLQLESSSKHGYAPNQLAALPAHLRHARALSEALDVLPPEVLDGLLLAAHRLALHTEAVTPSGQRALQYSWLYVLARTRHVRQDFLFDAAAAFSTVPLSATSRLSNIELSSLLLMQWASRGYLGFPWLVYGRYKRLCLGQEQQETCEGMALGSLCLALTGQEDKPLQGLYFSVWKLMATLKRTDEVLPSLALVGRIQNLPRRMLERLAYTSDNHHIAIQLRDLWARRSEQQNADRGWHPGIFDKYVDDIVQDPSIPPKTIWRVLDVSQLERRRGLTKSLALKMRRHRGTYGARRAAVAEKAVAAFARADHLPRRSVLRHVSQGYLFIRAVRSRVPPSVILALYRLVTKDLWEQKPGVTKRLLWFLSTVERQYGPEVAWSCRLGLRQWRAMLKWAAQRKGRA